MLLLQGRYILNDVEMMVCRENPKKIGEKTCSSVTSFRTNLMILNPGLRCEKPVSTRLCCGTDILVYLRVVRFPALGLLETRRDN
jgi:hypothetical protein